MAFFILRWDMWRGRGQIRYMWGGTHLLQLQQMHRLFFQHFQVSQITFSNYVSFAASPVLQCFFIWVRKTACTANEGPGGESNINICFQFMYSQKWNCMAWPYYFQNRIIIFCHPISSFLYLWHILRIYKLFTDTWIEELGTRPSNFISGDT